MITKNIDIKSIVPAPYNPRKIKPEELDKLVKSIQEFGYCEPIIINEQTGHCVGGHQRLKALQKLGYKEVTAVIVDLEEQKEKALNIALNKISGEWDFTLLKDLIEDLDDGQFDLELTGFDLSEIENLMTFVPDEKKEVQEDNFNSEPPKQAITLLGDLYELNKHRLHCADSTDIKAVEKLMDGKKADMVFTDPPYGINYEGGQETMFIHGGQINIKRDKLLNDSSLNIYADFIPLLSKFTSNIFYMFYGAGSEVNFYSIIKNSNIELINTLIWNKPRGSGALNANYKPCYESFIYAKLPKGQRLWSGNHNQWTVFDYSKDQCEEHPTQKPIKLIVDLLLNHIANLIADPFLGSGSTLIACEQLNRICYGQELAPEYCDVIVKRYVTFMRKENKPYSIKKNGIELSENEIEKYFEN